MENKNDKFDQMIQGSIVKNQERKQAKKRKEVNAKVSKRSGNVISQLELLLLRKEQRWHDDDYEYDKDW